MMNNEMTVAQLKTALVTASGNESESIALNKVIRSALVKFEGKQISKRMQTAVQAAFPDAVVHYAPGTFYCTISIWGGATGRKYENRFAVYFGGYQNNTFTLANYDEKNASCGTAAQARNDARERILANPVLLQPIVDSANTQKRAALALKSALATVLEFAKSGDETPGGAIFSTSEIESAVEAFLKL